jgi:hypothetical protein
MGTVGGTQMAWTDGATITSEVVAVDTGTGVEVDVVDGALDGGIIVEGGHTTTALTIQITQQNTLR